MRRDPRSSLSQDDERRAAQANATLAIRLGVVTKRWPRPAFMRINRREDQRVLAGARLLRCIKSPAAMTTGCPPVSSHRTHQASKRIGGPRHRRTTADLKRRLYAHKPIDGLTIRRPEASPAAHHGCTLLFRRAIRRWRQFRYSQCNALPCHALYAHKHLAPRALATLAAQGLLSPSVYASASRRKRLQPDWLQYGPFPSRSE